MKLKVSIEKLIIFLAILIGMSSGTFIFSHSIRYFLMALILLAMIATIYKKKSLYKPIGIRASFILFTACIVLSVLYSADRSSTILYAFIYVTSCVLMHLPMSEEFYVKIFKWFEITSIVFAISILVSVVFKTLMPSLYFLTGKSASAIAKDIQNGSYAGLAGDRAEAAVLMVIGITICWAKFSAKIEQQNTLFPKILLFYAALMLTSKRTMFVCSLIIPFIVILIFTKGKRRSMMITLAIIGCIVMVVLMRNVSVFNNILVRLLDTDDFATLNGRAKLWEVSIQMFVEHPILGTGFNSFNLLANETGVRYGGSLGAEWKYQGHNSYLQILGELGIVGFVLFMSLKITFITTSLRIVKLKNILDSTEFYGVCVSFFMIIIFTLYAFTGNCEYYLNQVFLQCLAYSYVASLNSKLRRREINVEKG